MFTTNPAPTHSTLGTGARAKALATTSGHTGPTTRTVLTATTAEATEVAAALNAFAAATRELLLDDAVTNRGTVCYLRRSLMAALTGAPTGPVPRPGEPELPTQRR